MATKDISQARNPALRGSLNAMHRAARQARDRAIRTNTAIITRRNGRTVRISAAELRQEQALEDGPE